ncbi:hypothetical protein PISMIDRAFT_197877 [Pisolithus microcarpus 441]|uniref:Uncharacterized protein n=1 Tax=Pisolithus microcarpus 441 TaxID=765257 RepID=A0A0C9Z6T8_9AGAM|nr:hypothetical protein PISMIDRAFT_197877 [Pisolithus microcarpus 441]
MQYATQCFCPVRHTTLFVSKGLGYIHGKFTFVEFPLCFPPSSTSPCTRKVSNALNSKHLDYSHPKFSRKANAESKVAGTSEAAAETESKGRPKTSSSSKTRTKFCPPETKNGCPVSA